MAFHLTLAQLRAADSLSSDAKHILLPGGGRAGKTFLLIYAIITRALRVADSRHIVFRSTFSSVKASVVLETLPKVLNLAFPELPSCDSMLNKTDWYLRLPNGSEVWFSGLESGERMDKVLGKEYSTIFFNEASLIPYQSIELAISRLAQLNDLAKKVYYDLNPTSKMHWSYVQFFDKKNPITKQPLPRPDLYTQSHMTPKDNIENIDPGYIEELMGHSESQQRRFLQGRYSDANDGQLFTPDVIEVNRRLARADKPLPDFQRIVIGVDPSGCSGDPNTRSDAIGIVVVGLGTDGHGYLLEDLTVKGAPETWSTVVSEAYFRHRADRIVAESNYGGDMVRAVLQARNPDLPVEMVTATRGKVVRAEPISELYAQGKVHHVGYFEGLESELCCMLQSGYVGTHSPNRADALVWAVTSLFPRIVRHDKTKDYRNPVVISPGRGASRFDRRL
jgi:phage terminase large subunit-like protein